MSEEMLTLTERAKQEIGTEEGDTCNRYIEPDKDQPCLGVMGYASIEGCSCHIAPPCERCVSNPLVCDVCGEEA